MAPHSNTLAWKTPWTEEPGRLQPVGSQRVEHDLATEQQESGQWLLSGSGLGWRKPPGGGCSLAV